MFIPKIIALSLIAIAVAGCTGERLKEMATPLLSTNTAALAP
jgi:hypothetical protein